MSRFDHECVKGFLHAEGRILVNGEGEQVILRGVGIGNWTNPEGFMIGGGMNNTNPFMEKSFFQPARFERGRSMYSTIAELCGRDYADTFESRWYRNYLRREDIQAIAQLGFNSIRLPIGSRMLLKEGPGLVFNEDLLQHMDEILDWCEEFKIYCILDLHAAPGGQSGLGCDDGLDNMGRFFFEPETRERGIVIWETLAERYKDRWIVGGFDLLNEPLSTPMLSDKYEALKDFYDECVSRIRAIDKNHLITLEGIVVSSDIRIFDHDYDPECRNWCIHMHQYGFNGDAREIYPVLAASRALNVPVWYGEGNSGLQEDAVGYEMLAYYGIGFNQWSWKSAGHNGQGMGISIYENPKDFDKVAAYFQGGLRPSYEEAIRIFDEVLECVRFEHCVVNEERVRYTLHQQGITLPAAAYAYGQPQDDLFSRTWFEGNAWAYRTDDQTRLTLKDGLTPETGITRNIPGFKPSGRGPLDELLLELHEGEYTTYRIRDLLTRCPVTLKARAVEDARICVKSRSLESYIDWPKGEFAEKILLSLPTGAERDVRITVLKGTLQIESITFETR